MDTAGDLIGAFQAWLAAQITSAKIALAADGSARTEGISIVVTRVESGALDRGAGARLAIEISALLLVDHPEPTNAATLAGELVFSLSAGQWTDQKGQSHRVDFADSTATDAAVAACGRPSALAVLVRLPLVRERKPQAVSPVLKPLVVEIGEMGVLEGIVLGERPGESPLSLPNARVSAAAFGRSTVSGRDGRFRLSGLPPEGVVTLTIEARGSTSLQTVSERGGVKLIVPIHTPTDAYPNAGAERRSP